MDDAWDDVVLEEDVPGVPEGVVVRLEGDHAQVAGGGEQLHHADIPVLPDHIPCRSRS